jgi:hypothetical protein
VLKIIDNVLPHSKRLVAEIGHHKSIEHAVGLFKRFQYIGPFTGYEFACDLYHTDLLRDAVDIYSWGNAGPGATRALGRMYDRKVDIYRDDPAQQRWCLERMRELRELREQQLGRPVEMRAVEHSLCGFDKYVRATIAIAQGKHPSLARYDGGCPHGCDSPLCRNNHGHRNGNGQRKLF